MLRGSISPRKCFFSGRNKFITRILEILLGVVLGMLLALSGVKYRENRFGKKAVYGEWRKLNLILDVVERNYVDTIDIIILYEENPLQK